VSAPPRLERALAAFWRGLRAWCGDSAYEIYAARTPAAQRLDRRAFYLDALRRRYRQPNRCC
jgi:hypothetical protein